MSLDITRAGAVETTGNTTPRATDGAKAAEETNETLFDGAVKTVNNVDLAYVEEELGVLESIGEKLGLDLTGDTEKDLDALNEYPGKLDEMLEKIEKLIEEKMQELKNLENEQARLIADEKTIQAQIDKLNNEKVTNQKEQQETAKKLEETQINNMNAQAEYQANYNSAMADAEASYNPETDGDKQEYINNALSGFGGANITDVSSMKSDLSSLQSKGASIDSNISVTTTTLVNVQDKIKTVDVEINAVRAAIETANNDKKDIQAEKATIPAKAKEVIKNAVGPEEWGIVEQNNIDLSEKLEDGSPRYVLAKGGRDEKFHIYDMHPDVAWKNSDAYGAHPSIVRLHAPNRGFDIIANSNGYLDGLKASESTELGKKGNSGVGSWHKYTGSTYAFSLSDTEFSSTKQLSDYKTCSPLAFDMNGNGIETSDELIKYDIDGDGELDNINNVLEGVLAFDLDGDGIAGENGKELFGNNTDLDGDGKADGYKDGFEALKALANKEGLIDGDKDMALDEKDLNFLSEKYGLTMKMGYLGESKSLDSLGITQINLAKTDETNLEDNFDGKFNQLMTQEGATFVQNGKEKDYVDVWNAKK